ncbi:hypothetical protein FEM48_Zijuj06G0075200 [Ziziphus jujuba var. spinosa]|uniref:Uncharacterized protein n=1 Tax=Ziziphus jujuba var. spinosa TaxID=714518 RepID=A0A978V7Z6_ZIZJJ|nr:hypothetical protein FEM48_Zijuj06G0075200 [Ziziphus jujuba var. spinosa]
MCSMVPKSQPTNTKYKTNPNPNNNNNNMVEEQEDPSETKEKVTSHIYIKPAHSIQPWDKEVVLRRIRQRKRVNKVRAALQAFLSPFSAKPNRVSMHQNKWVDDAFAAL